MSLVCRGLRFVIGALIVALVISVAVGVVYRYALQQSLYWATEVPNFLLVWTVFLGSVVAFHENKHIAFTALLDATEGKTRFALEILVLLIVLVFLCALIVFGIRVVIQTMSSPSEALKIPQGYIYACVPIAGTLMTISTIENLYKLIRRVGG